EVSGFLRRLGVREPSPEDVLVIVAPEEQRKLAEAKPGALLQILAREDRIPTSSEFSPEHNSKYDGDVFYPFFVAGGYGIRILFHSKTEEHVIRISGEAMSEDDLR